MERGNARATNNKQEHTNHHFTKNSHTVTKTTTWITSTLHDFFLLESDLVKWSEHVLIGTEDYRLINPIARGQEEVELLSSELASRVLELIWCSKNAKLIPVD